MNEQKHIVFLYSQRFVPPQIIQMAREQVPAGFALDLFDQDSPAAARLEKFAQADFSCSPIQVIPQSRNSPQPRSSSSRY